jgi:sulfate transport system substrate-binding protein
MVRDHSTEDHFIFLHKKVTKGDFRMTFQKLLQLSPALVLFMMMLLPGQGRAEVTILNVSSDSTRELYQEFNAAFAKYWEEKTGEQVRIQMSHGGAEEQARAVIDGLEAHVVTLASEYDIDTIVKQSGVIAKNWRSRLPHNSTPYTSTIVFLVRKGNPKNIKDWNDLVKPGISVVTPNPKTSGGAQWSYLAGWAFAANKFQKDEKKIHEFMTHLYRNVPVLDFGARGSTTTFVQRGIGDVLLAWENEALFATKTLDQKDFEIVVPSSSILAEPPVAVVDRVVDKKGTRKVAQAYLEYLYSKEGQEIAAKHFFRPRDPEVLAKYAAQFPNVEMVTVDAVFGGWRKAQKTHFSEGGTFDHIYGTVPPILN